MSDEPQHLQHLQPSFAFVAGEDTGAERQVAYLAWLQRSREAWSTDDTFTPPAVYDAVVDWATREYDLTGARVLRPFYPGGDYEREDYPAGSVVIDNPPFSIVSRVVQFYESRNVRYFLFAPHLTLFNVPARTHVVVGSSFGYENTKRVNMSFATNLDERYTIRTAPDLRQAIELAARTTQAAKLPRYDYPDNAITAARLSSVLTQDFRVVHGEASGRINGLDSQRKVGKCAFGGCRLISDAAAAQLRELQTRPATPVAARVAARVWHLSARERQVVEELNGKAATRKGRASTLAVTSC